MEAGDTQYSANMVHEVVQGVSRLLLQRTDEEEKVEEELCEVEIVLEVEKVLATV